MTETATRTLWCAYAVVGPVGEHLRRELGGELELVGGPDISVVVGEVAASEFGDDVLETHLNDRAWLEQAVVEHESVVQRLLPMTAVVPLRFGSLHRNKQAVQDFLATRRADFTATLAQVRGRVELGVKVWLTTSRAEAAESQPATGREYLERRRAARRQVAADRASLDARLRAIHERLLSVADAAVLNRPQPRELTGDSREMAMNAAYLVPAGDQALDAEVERLGAGHPDLAFEVTGPWAPYNFVERPEP